MRWRSESSFDKLFLQCIIFIREGYFTGNIERRVKRLYNSISMDSDKQHHKQILEAFRTGGRKASWPLTAWSRNGNYIEKPIQAVVFERAENWTQTYQFQNQRAIGHKENREKLLGSNVSYQFVGSCAFPRSFIALKTSCQEKINKGRWDGKPDFWLFTGSGFCPPCLRSICSARERAQAQKTTGNMGIKGNGNVCPDFESRGVSIFCLTGERRRREMVTNSYSRLRTFPRSLWQGNKSETEQGVSRSTYANSPAS